MSCGAVRAQRRGWREHWRAAALTHTHTHTHTHAHAHTRAASAPKSLFTCLHDTLLQRFFYDKDRNLTTDGVLLTGVSKGSDIAVYNKGNHLLEAFGYARVNFTMKPFIYNPSFTAANGAGWYQAYSSYGFSGIYKEAEDQTGAWRARQKESVAALVAARMAAGVGGSS